MAGRTPIHAHVCRGNCRALPDEQARELHGHIRAPRSSDLPDHHRRRGPGGASRTQPPRVPHVRQDVPPHSVIWAEQHPRGARCSLVQRQPPHPYACGSLALPWPFSDSCSVPVRVIRIMAPYYWHWHERLPILWACACLSAPDLL